MPQRLLASNFEIARSMAFSRLLPSRWPSRELRSMERPRSWREERRRERKGEEGEGKRSQRRGREGGEMEGERIVKDMDGEGEQ